MVLLSLIDMFGPAIRKLKCSDRLGVCSQLIMFLEEEQASHERALQMERANKRPRLKASANSAPNPPPHPPRPPNAPLLLPAAA